MDLALAIALVSRVGGAAIVYQQSDLHIKQWLNILNVYLSEDHLKFKKLATDYIMFTPTFYYDRPIYILNELKRRVN